MQDLVLIKDGMVTVQCDGKSYADTVEHFRNDSSMEMVEIDYNKTLKTCFIDGEPCAFPDDRAEKILSLIDVCAEKKERREQLAENERLKAERKKWEEEAARAEEERLAGLSLDERKQEKLAELNKAFEAAAKEARCRSSLGFEIDADETANRNVASLILAMEATGEESVPFCAYDNTFHNVTLAQLKTLQLEIIAHARALYARKWALRETMAGAESIEALNAIALTFETVSSAGEENGQTV